MSTDTDTRRVLDLLAQGKITVEEAHKLIDALAAASAPPSDGPSAARPRPAGRARGGYGSTSSSRRRMASRTKK